MHVVKYRSQVPTCGDRLNKKKILYLCHIENKYHMHYTYKENIENFYKILEQKNQRPACIYIKIKE